MERASFYRVLAEKRVQCQLCPNYCVISEGHRGTCLVRINRSGELYSEVYQKYSSINLDPIEKKPLYHFYPGTTVLSVGTKGCNLKCKFCQNHQISQCLPGDFPHMVNFPFSHILDLAQGYNNCIGLAYTYNEPCVFYESMYQLARRVHQRGMKNVMVTNGFINKAPLNELLEYIDAFNVDLKSFNNHFYKRYTHSRLAPVLATLETIGKSGKHLEITNLIIPGLNSDEGEFEEMTRWIAGELGAKTVLHISRYFPAYHMSITPTSVDLLLKLYEIARKHLNYVYLGNVTSRIGSDTYCNECGTELIRRFQYTTQVVAMTEGQCDYCSNQVIPHSMI